MAELADLPPAVARDPGQLAASAPFVLTIESGALTLIGTPQDEADYITSRILWLEGMERENRSSYSRMIYIHGTPEEWKKKGEDVSGALGDVAADRMPVRSHSSQSPTATLSSTTPGRCSRSTPGPA